jgi:hypothetical protein
MVQLSFDDPETDAVVGYHNLTFRAWSEDFALTPSVVPLGDMEARGNDAPRLPDAAYREAPAPWAGYRLGPSEAVPGIAMTPIHKRAAYAWSYGVLHWEVASDEHTWRGTDTVTVEPGVDLPYLYPAVATLGLVGLLRVPRYVGGRWK